MTYLILAFSVVLTVLLYYKDISVLQGCLSGFAVVLIATADFIATRFVSLALA